MTVERELPRLSGAYGRVAVVHDWLTGMRGGESVLEAILDLFPQADLFTLFHKRGSVSPKIESRVIHTSSLQPIAFRAGDYRRLLPLYPRAAREWDLSGYDLIVSSSHAVVKGVRAAGKPHLCYCHTPMRYIWDRFDDYFPRSKPLQRAAMMAVAPFLRRWDVATAVEVSRFVANSTFVANRIRQFYGREADVVHPFVDDDFLLGPLDSTREEFHLVVSALVPYKRIDLAVDAARAAGRRLVVIGGGPLRGELERRGGPNVRFLGSVSRETIVDHLARARSLILPGIEDFGITPLEAMALGTPVVAFGEGGVLDSVADGITGIFFKDATVGALADALGEAESREWDREAMRRHAAQFSRERFSRELLAALARIRTSG